MSSSTKKYPMQNGCTTLYIYTLYLSSLSSSWCTYTYSHTLTTKLNNVLLNSYGGPHTFASIVDIKRNKKMKFALQYATQYLPLTVNIKFSPSLLLSSTATQKNPYCIKMRLEFRINIGPKKGSLPKG